MYPLPHCDLVNMYILPILLLGLECPVEWVGVTGLASLVTPRRVLSAAVGYAEAMSVVARLVRKS